MIPADVETQMILQRALSLSYGKKCMRLKGSYKSWSRWWGWALTSSWTSKEPLGRRWLQHWQHSALRLSPVVLQVEDQYRLQWPVSPCVCLKPSTLMGTSMASEDQSAIAVTQHAHIHCFSCRCTWLEWKLAARLWFQCSGGRLWQLCNLFWGNHWLSGLPLWAHVRVHALWLGAEGTGIEVPHMQSTHYRNCQGLHQHALNFWMSLCTVC